MLVYSNADFFPFHQVLYDYIIPRIRVNQNLTDRGVGKSTEGEAQVCRLATSVSIACTAVAHQIITHLKDSELAGLLESLLLHPDLDQQNHCSEFEALIKHYPPRLVYMSDAGKIQFLNFCVLHLSPSF